MTAPASVPAPAPEHLRERLTRDRVAWLCTLRPDGSPHLTPVWFVHLRGSWWIGSDRGNVKIRNLAADPRVSLALEDGASPVVAEGRAVVRPADDPAVPADVRAALDAKYGWDVTADRGHGKRVIIEVPVTRWLLAGTAQ